MKTIGVYEIVQMNIIEFYTCACYKYIHCDLYLGIDRIKMYVITVQTLQKGSRENIFLEFVEKETVSAILFLSS